MTIPRKILAGLTYFLTRRCTQRMFLLRPSKYVKQVLLYCLAEAAKRFNITVYAYVAMSNHIHMVVRDNDANLPEFMCHFYKMVAKVLNAHWGRRENLWSNDQANVVHCVQDNDRFEKIIYTLANPVADHLVARAQEWPGATSYSQLLAATTLVLDRPRGYFGKKSRMPKTATLTLGRPDGFEELTREEWSKKVRDAVVAKEKKASEQRDADENVRRRFVGRKAVLAALHTQTAKRIEPRSELAPDVACRDGKRRGLELEALMRFRKAYAIARKEWCSGSHGVLFPLGTYKMRKDGVCVMPPSALAHLEAMAAATAVRGVRKATSRAKSAASSPSSRAS